MMRIPFPLFVLGLLWSASLIADDAGKSEQDDPIAVELRKAKAEFVSSKEKATEKLTADFDEIRKRVEDSTTLKVEQRLKLLEQIQQEKTAFETNPSRIPSLVTMKSAVSDFQLRIAAARKKCEAAYDKAADSYDKKKDLASARKVLDEKASFFVATSKSFVGSYDRLKILADGSTATPQGKKGKWSLSKGVCVIKWESGWIDTYGFDKNGKDLIGKSMSPKGKETEITAKAIDSK